MKSLLHQLEEWVDYNLKNCLGVDECMKACPVVEPDININQLNEATRPGTPVPPNIMKFAHECIQCARCDPVCPASCGRSILMLYLKAKLAMQKRMHPSYKKYLRLKGHDRNPLAISGFNLLNRRRLKKLAAQVDKKELKPSPVLFYFGCYIFTHEESVHQTLALADHLGLDYEVLAGLRSCCGWPQLLGGELAAADDYHDHLHRLIQRVNPREVITGCAECYMSLTRIVTEYKADFLPLSTTQWLLNHQAELDLRKTDEPLTYHDSCHLSRKQGMAELPRRLIGRLAELKEMKRHGGDDTFCCGYWAFGANPAQLKALHRDRFQEAKATGGRKMVVECITCLESFHQHSADEGIQVVDIVELVYNNVMERAGNKP
jgi:Fe-S oxidoreductase